MAQVAQLGKLPRQILLAFRVLPSDRKIFSRQLEKIFPTTGKNFPDNWKNFSFRQEELFQLSVRKPFKFSKIENFLVELQKKFFLPTGKIFPSDRKKFSRQLENIFHPTGHKRMTDVPLPECLPKPEEPTAPAPQQTY
ncbi:hypothetical protein TVAG_022990 [Trichomonas vaginalis G3]|uniref:Uncharacterized protein n=1 Tax=Trichomonas vaginalis (strain ATCC PRA-98 / G3) TaxID=412133 RepID=A2GDZ1_TRIV3|nr:hypothetical protein TVAGG3_0349790 [Trichomonas vaginalis G3]EAX84624.1 hypothetical protein TVAG_022990 [Trichomonas vaginalis G3]KAI5531200.1 hypothetical protein TVAGG3_0349790 [Trichomonas vaginalis G3]|eukprot:XP_001297554.1 hypothetical protein [Trichomonas vaginalis G3]